MSRRERVVFAVFGVGMVLGGEQLAFAGARPDPWPAVGWWLLPTGVVFLLVAIAPPVARNRRPTPTPTGQVEPSRPGPQPPTPTPLPRPRELTHRPVDLHGLPR